MLCDRRRPSCLLLLLSAALATRSIEFVGAGMADRLLNLADAVPDARIRTLSASEAAAIDAELMADPGFSIDQLMELAGLAVATAVYKTYPPSSHPRVLVICGPGNNGGDGLVAARHMSIWGYRPTVVYPKRPTKGDSQRLFGNLVNQLERHEVPILTEMPSVDEILGASPSGYGLDAAGAAVDDVLTGVLDAAASGQQQLHQQQHQAGYDVLLDAVFGFSFQGDVRPPFDTVLSTMTKVAERSRWPIGGGVGANASTAIVDSDGSGIAVESGSGGGSASGIPVACVDIPSGWHVEDGPPDGGSGASLRPSMLVSLTAPKRCTQHLEAGVVHWLGGRFLPPALASRFDLDKGLPQYQGCEQVVRLQ